MALSKQLQTTLRQFHLDNPDATWDELRDHLRYIAEDILATPTEWERMDSMGLVYSEVEDDLYRIAVTTALTRAQAQAVTLGRQIMMAAQERVIGDPRQLVDLIGKINEGLGYDSKPHASLPLSVAAHSPSTARSAPKRQPPLTFAYLADLYMKEQEANLQPITMRTVRSACKALSEGFGLLDLRNHTRADMVSLREALRVDRKPSTVNALLTRMSSVLGWGVNNGYLERTFDKKLKIAKGAESSREAFTQQQVADLMRYASTLPEDSWERWALSLGVVTGARINEIRQLSPSDVRQIGEIWVIDINSDGAKDLKNKHSARLVPLIDKAYGFDLTAFHRYVSGVSPGEALFPATRIYMGQALGKRLRAALKIKAGGSLTFHSLRHSLASLLKEHEVSLGTAQAILGHSSQSITFDHYGAGQRVGVEKLADALRRVLPIAPK